MKAALMTVTVITLVQLHFSEEHFCCEVEVYVTRHWLLSHHRVNKVRLETQDPPESLELG